MRIHERCFAGLVVLLLVATACTGASAGSEVAEPPGVATAVTGTPEDDPTEVTDDDPSPETPEPEPTVDPRDGIPSAEFIDAALTQFEADVAAGEIRAIAFYDVLETSINDEGNVTITVCGWSGESVFDSVRDSLYRTGVDDTGSITAQHITTPTAQGECLNTELIESALDHVNQFDAFWNEAVQDPVTFADDPRTALLDSSYSRLADETIDGFIADDVYFLGIRAQGAIEQAALTDLLWRRFTAAGVELLEVVVCRRMDPIRGMYRDDVLIDDGKDESSTGDHSVDSFQLILNEAGSTEWLISGRQTLIWADCFGGESWPAAVNEWQTGPTSFVVLDQ